MATDYVSYLKQLDDIKPEEGEGDANKMQGQSLIDDFIKKGDERLMLDIGAPRRKPKHVLPKFSSNADSEDDALAAEDEAVSPSVQDEMPMGLKRKRFHSFSPTMMRSKMHPKE